MADGIGFIGLGLMGKPLCLDVLKHGFPLVVHSRSQAPVNAMTTTRRWPRWSFCLAGLT